MTDLIAELKTQGKDIKQQTIDTVTKNIKFNQDWTKSSISNDLSAFIKNSQNLLRLPKTVKPEHYEIYLDASNVHTGALPYSGNVKIDVKILITTDRIILHSKDHGINGLKVTYADTNQEIPILEYYQNDVVDTLEIYFFDFLAAEIKVRIEIDFSAKLLTEIDGFYQDSYVEFDQYQSPIRKYLATTQFQAVEARRAFPCFDGMIL